MPSSTKKPPTKMKPNGQRTPGKRNVPGPTHLGHFMMVMLMKGCRSILSVDPTVKVFVYFGLIMTLTVVSALFVVPKSYLSQKNNVFNVYFLKLGWGWTLFGVGSYIALSSYVYCSRDVTKICKQLLRLLFGTFWWYFCTAAFRRLEHSVGSCVDPTYGDPRSCRHAGKSWRGFDISGHIFLQVFCSLLIIEELKTFKHWKKLGIILEDEDLKDKRPMLSSIEIDQAKKDYNNFTPLVKISVVIVTVMAVLFDMMMITSSLYPFHPLSEEIPGFFFGVLGWFISYHVLFRPGHQHPFLHSVGQCNFAFMK